jgi:hypothetical protein
LLPHITSLQHEAYFSGTLVYHVRAVLRNCKTTLNTKHNEHSSQAKGTCRSTLPESALHMCVPWVSERSRGFSASKPSQELTQRDTKMRREEGKRRMDRRQETKNATLVHHTYTQAYDVKMQPTPPTLAHHRVYVRRYSRPHHLYT